MEAMLDAGKEQPGQTFERLKYQNDLLSAMNERLVDSDRMYKMITKSTGDLYYYRNFRHNITELIGPWEELLNRRPDPRSFRFEEIFELLYKGEPELFSERILNMERSGEERASLLLRFLKNNTKYLCTGTVYYDEKGEPTDKLIGFRCIG